MITFALIMAMQSAAPLPPPADGKPAPWPEHEKALEVAGAFDKDGSPAARRELEQFAGCIVGNNPGEAARVLRMDFTTGAYSRALRMLSQDNRDCFRYRGSMRSAGLLFAGELAESLLESDSAPLVSRLAKASAGEATPSYSFTDKVAICVVRSVPNDVAALFATARGSAEETAGLDALATPMAMCARAANARQPIAVNPAGLRAMLATASYRSIANGENS